MFLVLRPHRAARVDHVLVGQVGDEGLEEEAVALAAPGELEVDLDEGVLAETLQVEDPEIGPALDLRVNLSELYYRSILVICR